MAMVPMINSGAVAVIDDRDAEKVSDYRWSTYRIGRTFYAMSGDPAHKRVYLHRLIAGEPGMEVDHRNGDGMDNRRSNLRVAPHALNLANQRPQLGRMSRFKGVSMRPSGRFYAYIKVNQKMRHLGTYVSEVDAAMAYNAAALEAWGEFARLNIVEPAA